MVQTMYYQWVHSYCDSHYTKEAELIRIVTLLYVAFYNQNITQQCVNIIIQQVIKSKDELHTLDK